MSELFGGKGQAFGNLFSKSTVIDNDKLVNEKQRTVLELNKAQQDDMEVDESEAEAESESKEESEEEKEEIKNLKSKKSTSEDDLEERYMKKLLAEESKEEETTEGKPEAETDIKQDSEDTENKEETQNSESKQASGAQVVDLKQKEFEKAERTVFIGNVPSSVMENKKTIKAFKRHINEFLNVPEHQNYIESIRFRGLHSQTNATKKVAFISKDVDMKASMVSYVVLKTKELSNELLKMNGTFYEKNHLRVDHLAHPQKKDNQLSVFVGNVSFEENEENLWKYFNSRIIEKNSDVSNVVDNVRIVRDSKTSFGKGFAIVQFTDTNYVSKALLLDGKKMNNRALRITRCKKMKRNNDQVRKKTQGLSDKQKTIIGRAKVLNKADRSTIGKMVIEGERAQAGSSNSIKKPRHKKRLTDRSQAFKKKGMKQREGK
ncbi:Nop12 protein [Martiniozyma asiatica (nom. inval.)]|nr:Nop12 protein [Martiniozyma asiatica]